MMQLLVEGVVLSLLAGASGLLVAVWGTELLAAVRVSGAPIPVELDVSLNRNVLVYTLVVSLLTPLVFGLVPAMRATRLHLDSALHHRTTGMSATSARSRLLSGLVAAQIALAMVLVSGAGLCLKSVRNALALDPGFEVRNGLAMEINLAHGHYTEQEGKLLQRRLVDNVSSLPGVQSAALAFLAPLSYALTQAEISVVGYAPAPGESLSVNHNFVGPQYFETLGIPILDGRAIDEREAEGTEPVMVVNQTLARRYFGGRSPVGSTVRVFGEAVRVIGVAKDGKYFQLSESATPFFYVPMSQRYIASFTTLHVRTHADPKTIIEPVVREIERLAPNLPIQNPRTLSDHMSLSQYPARIVAVMIGSFGVIAILLAVGGVLGVMSYSVSQRTNEIGIRATLGATREQILWMMLGRGLKITFAGLAIGLGCGLLAARALGSFLLGVRPYDPAVYMTVGGVVGAAALLACYLPARHATNVDPIVALRQE
jgi:predicted permease